MDLAVLGRRTLRGTAPRYATLDTLIRLVDMGQRSLLGSGVVSRLSSLKQRLTSPIALPRSEVNVDTVS